MTKPESVGDRIAQARREKAARERRDIRPVDLARALGVSGATVSDWEAGNVTPRDDAMIKLADFLGVTPGYLRYGVRESAPSAPPVMPVESFKPVRPAPAKGEKKKRA